MKILCIFTTVKHQFKIVKNLRYNGNISGMQWQNGASAAKSGYKFSYGRTEPPYLCHSMARATARDMVTEK